MAEQAPGNPSPDEGVTVPPPHYVRPIDGDQLHQGELLQDVWEWVAKYDDQGSVVGAQPKRHSLALIVTQECDLSQDWRERVGEPMVQTELRNVLLCPAQSAAGLRAARDEINAKTWDLVRKNKMERYQYLTAVSAVADANNQGQDAILVDFKSFFSVRTIELYRQIRVTTEASGKLFTRLNCPWREHLQARFAAYQARVGLPQDHFIPENRRPALPTAVV